MGSIKVWWGEGCRPRLAVEDVLISLPTLRLSRKEGGKKWGTPGAYFYISGIRNWLRQVSGEMSRDRGKGWRHHSGSFLNLRDKAGAITNACSWPLIDDHPPLVLSLSLFLLICWLLSPVLYQFREFEQMKRILCPPDKKGMLQRVNHRTGAEWSIITINHLLIRNWQLMACLN